MRSAAIFPGQGSEYPGMLSCIREAEITSEIFGTLSAVAGKDILSAAFHEAPQGLADARISQLAVFGTSACYWHLLRGSAIFHCLAGHSLGVYAALYASGSVSLEDCARVILRVQDAIETVSEGRTGLMASIMGLKAGEVHKICRGTGSVFVSNVNSATQIVISGWEEETRTACSAALRAGALAAKELPIRFPLHSPLMRGVEDIIAPLVSAISIRIPAIPLFSHIDGTLLDPAGIVGLLTNQLTRSVLWRDTVKAMKQQGITRFVEVGPSDVLSKLARWIDRDAESVKAEELVPCQSL